MENRCLDIHPMDGFFFSFSENTPIVYCVKPRIELGLGQLLWPESNIWAELKLYCFFVSMCIYTWQRVFTIFQELCIFYLVALDLSCGMWDLVPWPGIESRSLTLEARSLSQWTTKEVPNFISNSCNVLFGRYCYAYFIDEKMRLRGPSKFSEALATYIHLFDSKIYASLPNQGPLFGWHFLFILWTNE